MSKVCRLCGKVGGVIETFQVSDVDGGNAEEHDAHPECFAQLSDTPLPTDNDGREVMVELVKLGDGEFKYTVHNLN
jgi:hypothetical protein